MGRIKLNWLFIKAHLATQWSSQSNFWAGVLGMLINNGLTLFGIWAMLFAGKTNLQNESLNFFVMNFILMLAYGLINVFWGGVADLDKQISEGGLDLALTSPQSPFLLLSMTRSHLPAWGDLLLGFFGLIAVSVFLGPLFFIKSLGLSVFATLAMYSVFLFIGCLAFWLRRTDAAASVLINICLAFNTYPIVDTGTGLRWVFFLIPVLLVGALPTRFLLFPSWDLLLFEIVGSLMLFYFTRRLFYFGLKRYQSAAGIGLRQ